MRNQATDEQYYQVARPHSLSERVVIAARNRIYADFMRLCKPAASHTIADVGVSDVVTDAANFLERLYPHPGQITALGLGEGVDFKKSYPAIKYIQIQPGDALPIQDKTFDVATANAVLEHVGSVIEQRRFVSELARISRTTYITVPHRYFPIEHHTGFPFVHYSDRLFQLVCSVSGKEEWAQQQNLILMSKRHLRSLVPEGASFEIGYTGLSMGLFSSNLYLLIRDAVV